MSAGVREAPDTTARCRALLADVTPLPGDCGRLCGAACCASLPCPEESGDEEETGMLLFPGEEELYRDRPGWSLRPAAGGGTLLVCPGRCDRQLRPIACRMFPLLPLARGDGQAEIRVAMDARARAVCPLTGSGVRGLQPAFVEAVRACGELLLADPGTRGALLALTAQHDELREMQKRFGGG